MKVPTSQVYQKDTQDYTFLNKDQIIKEMEQNGKDCGKVESTRWDLGQNERPTDGGIEKYKLMEQRCVVYMGTCLSEMDQIEKGWNKK